MDAFVFMGGEPLRVKLNPSEVINPCGFSDLPVEAIDHIFKFLNFQELVQISPVSKHWYSVTIVSLESQFPLVCNFVDFILISGYLDEDQSHEVKRIGGLVASYNENKLAYNLPVIQKILLDLKFKFVDVLEDLYSNDLHHLHQKCEKIHIPKCFTDIFLLCSARAKIMLHDMMLVKVRENEIDEEDEDGFFLDESHIEEYENEDYVNNSFKIEAIRLAEYGDYERAVEVVNRLPILPVSNSETLINETLSEIIEITALNGNFKKAIELHPQLIDDYKDVSHLDIVAGFIHHNKIISAMAYTKLNLKAFVHDGFSESACELAVSILDKGHPASALQFASWMPNLKIRDLALSALTTAFLSKSMPEYAESAVNIMRGEKKVLITLIAEKYSDLGDFDYALSVAAAASDDGDLLRLAERIKKKMLEQLAAGEGE